MAPSGTFATQMTRLLTRVPVVRALDPKADQAHAADDLGGGSRSPKPRALPREVRLGVLPNERFQHRDKAVVAQSFDAREDLDRVTLTVTQGAGQFQRGADR